PALLFDEIIGFPRGFRVFTNATTSPQRAALALGIDPDLRPIDALRTWKERRATLRPVAPVGVKDAPALANSMAGPDVELRRFPARYWHRRDGGSYIGSGSLVITGDPDSDWINASIYRVQVHDEKHATVQFDHLGRHGVMIATKYWDRGQACPIAVA